MSGYGNIYVPKSGSISILDNQKFIQPNALVYEAPPKTTLFDEESVETKMGYTYGIPSDYILNDDASFRVNRFNEGLEWQKYEKSKETPENMKKTVEKFVSDPKKEDDNYSCGSTDDGVNICGGTNLYPILDPRFNLREAAKNMILLEDHLFHYGKRCQDCILKHCLTIEGLLEEGITLDKNRKYYEILDGSQTQFRVIFQKLSNKIKSKNLLDEECCSIAQEIRKIRKPLCQHFATFFE
jgi:hypothetical protein